MNALKSNLGAIVCFGYKWLGSPKTHVLTVDHYGGFKDIKTKGISDKRLLRAALRIMEKAGILVAHYGEKFDRRFFQGRCAINELSPPPPTKLRDTCLIARRAFNFSSNRLGALADTLGLSEQKQVKTRDEWPLWWHRVLAGDSKALANMASYCAQDVKTLEQVYLKLRVYDNPHPRLVQQRSNCRLCNGSVQYRGFAYVGEYVYRRFRCSGCGRWDRDRHRMEAK